MPAEKKVSKLHLIKPEYHRHNESVPSDRIMVIFKSGESELFDFELDSEVILGEGEDATGTDAHMYLVENEKQKEHDFKVTGVDSSQFVKLIVTSDVGGSIKIWSLEKRFMREIQFPHPIDSISFMNKEGDLLVSHVQRISKIKFATYWTSSFTHYGFTALDDPIHLNYKQTEATVETEMYDDHVYAKPPPGRQRVINDEHFNAIFRNKTEEELQEASTVVSKVDQQSTKGKTLAIGKVGQTLMNSINKNTGVNGAVSDAGKSAMEMSRLGDSTKKAQEKKNPFSSMQLNNEKGTNSGLNKSSMQAGPGMRSKLSDMGSKLDRASPVSRQQQQQPQTSQVEAPAEVKVKAQSSSVPARGALRLQRRKSSMTAFQLEHKIAQQEKARIEEEESQRSEMLRRLNGPGCRDAIPREKNPFAQKQVLQPLPGISYLSTSPVYYEMLAKRKKQKGQVKGLTRRKITENRISSNIMNFNAPTAVNDFSDMELSVDYHTQVAQHKYNQSNFLPLMNLQILSKIPIEQILNPGLDMSMQEGSAFDLGQPPAIDFAMSSHSRKSRSNMPFRTNSFGGGVSNDRASRNTNRSGKETAASHFTHGSNRHSLVKPIGFDGQQLQAMLQPNSSIAENQSNQRNLGRAGQRTNIMMTGNQIVGGNLSYPKTTRNMPGQQIQFNNQNVMNSNGDKAELISKAEGMSLSQFDNSLIIEGRTKQIEGIDRSMIAHTTDISKAGQSSFLGSDVRPNEAEQEAMKHNNINQSANISQQPLQVSLTTQETSKIGAKQGFSMGMSKHSDLKTVAKGYDTSILGAELTSIKEDPGTNGLHVLHKPQSNDGLVQDDSLIENDQPSQMQLKGRLPVGDYNKAITPEKNNMNLTGDSFADSIMSNHYQNK